MSHNTKRVLILASQTENSLTAGTQFECGVRINSVDMYSGPMYSASIAFLFFPTALAVCIALSLMEGVMNSSLVTETLGRL